MELGRETGNDVVDDVTEPVGAGSTHQSLHDPRRRSPPAGRRARRPEAINCRSKSRVASELRTAVIRVDSSRRLYRAGVRRLTNGWASRSTTAAGAVVVPPGYTPAIGPPAPLIAGGW